VETIDRAIRILAMLEKDARDEEGLLPVPGLNGNYREAANRHSAYFDDEGAYIKAEADAPVSQNAMFDRKGIQALYSKTEDKPAESAIKTWDDFYREIVHKYPQEEIVLSDQDKQDPRFHKVLEYMGGTLMLMRALGGKMINEEEIEEAILPLSSSSGHESFNSIGYMKSYWIPSPSGGIETKHELQRTEWHKLAYICDAARLTAMMRMGSKIYQQLMTSLFADADGLQLLEGASQNISAFAEDRLRCSPEQAKQLANVIMQGPDPYADKPLPLEVFYKQYRDQVPVVATPKKNKPKPPSAG
jgi:hypothetical protein